MLVGLEWWNGMGWWSGGGMEWWWNSGGMEWWNGMVVVGGGWTVDQ